MEEGRALSLEEIRAFLEASEGIRFEGKNRKEIYGWVKQTLVGQQYEAQGKAWKGLLRSYLIKMTGFSRAQVTRLIGQYLEQGNIEEKTYHRRRFPSLYTRRDIELLAEVLRVRKQGLSAVSADLDGSHLQPAQEWNISQTTDRLSGNAANGGEYRGEKKARSAGQTRIPAGGHSASRGPGWT
jgi:transposase